MGNDSNEINVGYTLKVVGSYCLLPEIDIIKLVLTLYSKNNNNKITKNELLTIIHTLHEYGEKEFIVNEICADIDKYINSTRDIDLSILYNLHISQPQLLYPIFSLQNAMMNVYLYIFRHFVVNNFG